ncbi:TonB-dependent receptor [Kordiimonas sp.]|uniref:TonB-dependent receptor n=1 Tax=Kordiimonas sp. TaxID=1970157 RepID=UPI003A8EFD48
MNQRKYGLSQVSTAAIACAAFISLSAQAQDTETSTDEETPINMEEIVISSSRIPTNTQSFAGSVSILDEEAIEAQRAINADIGAILGNAIPGMQTSSFDSNNRDSSLRGRKPAVLIDGVPIGTPLRNGDNELRSIDASAIGRIEVVRGSSALYGSDGAGGVINYVTRRPSAGATEFNTEVGTSLSLTHTGDSLAPFIRQSVLGGSDKVDFIVSGYAQFHQSSFDAEGDRVPPRGSGGAGIGLPESNVYNFFGKTGIATGDDSRLELSLLHYNRRQDPNWKVQNGNVVTGEKATAVPVEPGDVDGLDTGVKNTVGNLVYTNDEVFSNTSFRGQAYYQKYKNIFEAVSAGIFGGVGQSIIDSEKFGFRADFKTDLDFADVSWGADYSRDDTQQLLADGRIWAPPMVLSAVAGFVHLDVPVTERLHMLGGIRHERSKITVDDYLSLFGANVTGGKLDYSATLFDAGATYDLGGGIEAFAGFSQGFTVAEVGRILRDVREDTDILFLNPEAIKSNSYEIGLRGDFDTVRTSAVLYQNTSKKGLELVPDPANLDSGILIPELSPERIWGIELTLDADLSDSMRAGGSFAWMNGKRDGTGDGEYETPLNGSRIAPEKLTAYAEYDISDTWLVRLQALYSGNRNAFPGATGTRRQFEGEIHSFFVLDLLTSVDVGPGRLSVGVQNLLNNFYFPHQSQTFNRDDRYLAAPGATATIRYSMSY